MYGLKCPESKTQENLLYKSHKSIASFHPSPARVPSHAQQPQAASGPSLQATEYGQGLPPSHDATSSQGQPQALLPGHRPAPRPPSSLLWPLASAGGPGTGLPQLSSALRSGKPSGHPCMDVPHTSLEVSSLGPGSHVSLPWASSEKSQALHAARPAACPALPGGHHKPGVQLPSGHIHTCLEDLAGALLACSSSALSGF